MRQLLRSNFFLLLVSLPFTNVFGIDTPAGNLKLAEFLFISLAAGHFVAHRLSADVNVRRFYGAVAFYVVASLALVAINYSRLSGAETIVQMHWGPSLRNQYPETSLVLIVFWLVFLAGALLLLDYARSYIRLEQVSLPLAIGSLLASTYGLYQLFGISVNALPDLPFLGDTRNPSVVPGNLFFSRINSFFYEPSNFAIYQSTVALLLLGYKAARRESQGWIVRRGYDLTILLALVTALLSGSLVTVVAGVLAVFFGLLINKLVLGRTAFVRERHLATALFARGSRLLLILAISTLGLLQYVDTLEDGGASIKNVFAFNYSRIDDLLFGSSANTVSERLQALSTLPSLDLQLLTGCGVGCGPFFLNSPNIHTVEGINLRNYPAGLGILVEFGAFGAALILLAIFGQMQLRYSKTRIAGSTDWRFLPYVHYAVTFILLSCLSTGQIHSVFFWVVVALAGTAWGFRSASSSRGML